jgi:hypothetical protein
VKPTPGQQGQKALSDAIQIGNRCTPAVGTSLLHQSGIVSKALRAAHHD